MLFSIFLHLPKFCCVLINFPIFKKTNVDPNADVYTPRLGRESLDDYDFYFASPADKKTLMKIFEQN